MTSQADQGYTIAIDLIGNTTYRSRSRAYARWAVLKHMIRDIIAMGRNNLDFHLANELYTFARTPRFLIANAPHWTLDMTPAEWAALSRGLRGLGTPTANSMYQWLNQNRVHDHGD